MVDARALIEQQIFDLQASKRRLAETISELAHDGRRVSDALERVGGADHTLQKKLHALRKNIDRNEAEIGEAEKRLTALLQRLEGLGKI